MGRLVITHSTYIEGLIPYLKEIAENEGVKTITPAEIKRVKGKCSKFLIRISTSIRGGYKLIARKGSSAQVVFIITSYDKVELERIIREVLNKKK